MGIYLTYNQNRSNKRTFFSQLFLIPQTHEFNLFGTLPWLLWGLRPQKEVQMPWTGKLTQLFLAYVLERNMHLSLSLSVCVSVLAIYIYIFIVFWPLLCSKQCPSLSILISWGYKTNASPVWWILIPNKKAPLSINVYLYFSKVSFSVINSPPWVLVHYSKLMLSVVLWWAKTLCWSYISISIFIYLFMYVCMVLSDVPIMLVIAMTIKAWLC